MVLRFVGADWLTALSYHHMVDERVPVRGSYPAISAAHNWDARGLHLVRLPHQIEESIGEAFDATVTFSTRLVPEQMAEAKRLIESAGPAEETTARDPVEPDRRTAN